MPSSLANQPAHTYSEAAAALPWCGMAVHICGLVSPCAIIQGSLLLCMAIICKVSEAIHKPMSHLHSDMKLPGRQTEQLTKPKAPTRRMAHIFHVIKYSTSVVCIGVEVGTGTTICLSRGIAKPGELGVAT